MPFKNPEAMREYVRLRFHRRRAEVIERLGGRCVRCGSTDRLEIDHIDPSQKSYEWSLAGLSQAKLEAEIVKAQLLCYAHHLEKTSAERKQGVDKTPRT